MEAYVCFARINLAGMGIGDGWMSPYHNARYAKFLYQVELFYVDFAKILVPSWGHAKYLTLRLGLWMSRILTTVCLKSKPLKISSTEEICEWESSNFNPKFRGKTIIKTLPVSSLYFLSDVSTRIYEIEAKFWGIVSQVRGMAIMEQRIRLLPQQDGLVSQKNLMLKQSSKIYVLQWLLL